MRLIGEVFGNSVFATATVLAAFMGGLAIGSFAGGRIADRRTDRVRLYGLLEIGIGVYALLLPHLLALATPLYATVYQSAGGTSPQLILIRAVVCFAILVVPTTFMGATLPLLLRHFIQDLRGLGQTVGVVYATNTFGAVAGCVAAGFVLMPRFGLSRSLLVAAVINAAVGIIAIVFLQETPRTDEERATDTPGDAPPVLRTYPSIEGRAALAAFAISGFAAMADEVALFRAFALIIGSTTYAFSLMLTAFIFGIGLGSLFLARGVRQDRDLVEGAGLVQAGIAASCFVMVLLIGELPTWTVAAIGRFQGSFTMLQVSEFVLLFLILLIPTSLMGVMFPLTTAIWTRSADRIGRSSGEAYFVNTLGAILGSLMGGFLLLPFLGVQKTILAGALLNLAASATIFAVRSGVEISVRARQVGAIAVLGVAAALVMPAWDLQKMTSGPYLYAARRAGGPPAGARSIVAKTARDQGKVVYHRDGFAATVTVKKSPSGATVLMVNGKVDASSVWDVRTQKLLGHIPMLLHPDPKRVLVIGLGSGMTLGAVMTHEPDSAESVEISPEVVEAAELHFSPFNNDCLKNPRTRQIIGDGRNHVLLTNRTYDVISSQPSSPWIAGIGSLFTREFWEACRLRLGDDGVMCQWLQAYQVTPKNFRLVLRTFRLVFPHMTLWFSNRTDIVLIGSNRPLSVDLRRLRERAGKPDVRDDLRRCQIWRPLDIFGHFIAGPDEVKRLAGDGALHTDDNARLEFDMPRTLYQSHMTILDQLGEYQSSPLAIVRAESLGEGEGERLEALAKSAWCLNMGTQYLGSDPSRAYEWIRQARELAPEDPNALLAEFWLRFSYAKSLADGGQIGEAISVIEALLKLYPEMAALAQASPERVEHDFMKMDSTMDELFAQAANNMGEMIVARHRTRRPKAAELRPAIDAFRFALERQPDLARACTNLGVLLVQTGGIEEGIEVLQDALKLEESFRAHFFLGLAHKQQGDLTEALKDFSASTRIENSFWPAHFQMAQTYEALGRVDEAVQSYETVLKFQRGHREAQERLAALKSPEKGPAEEGPR